MTEATDVVDVRLRGVPIAVRAAFVDHTDGLLRELALIRIGAEGGTPTGGQERLLDVSAEFRASYVALQEQPAADLEAAEAAGLTACDVTYRVPRAVGAFVERLAAVMAEADEWCRDEEHLLTLPASPEVSAYRRWVFGEFTAQLAGAEPRPWSSPVPPHPASGPRTTDPSTRDGPVPTAAAKGRTWSRVAPAPPTTAWCDVRGCDPVDEPFLVPASARGVAAARRHVRAALEGLSVDDVSESAELGTSELVTNALLHAAPPVTLTVCRAGPERIRIAVTDSSAQQLHPRAAAVSATTGRGLRLLDRVSHAWGVDAVPADAGPGKTVWFEPAPDATRFDATEFDATEFDVTEFDAAEFDVREFGATEFRGSTLDATP